MSTIAYERWSRTTPKSGEHAAVLAARRSGLASLLADSQDDAVLVVDSDGLIVAANASLTRRTGFLPDEVIGARAETVVTAEHQLRVRTALEDSGGGSSARIEADGLKKDGRRCALAITFIPLVLLDGGTAGTLLLTQNLSEMSEALLAHDRDDQLLALAGKVAGFSGWSLDCVTEVISWSQGADRSLQARPETLSALLGLCSVADAATLRRAIETTTSHGRQLDLTVALTDSSNSQSHVRLVAEPIRGPGGEVLAISGAAHDVTDVVVAQLLQRDTENLLATTLNEITDGLVVVDSDWKITFINERLATMFAGDSDFFAGKSLWEMAPAIEGTEIAIALRRAFDTQTTVKAKDKLSSSALWVDVNAYPSRGGLAIHVSDVSEYEEAQIRARAAEERLVAFSRLVDMSQDAIVVRNTTGHIIHANVGAANLFGWHAPDLIGTTTPLPVDRDQYNAAWSSTRENGSWSGTFIVDSSSGRELVISSRWELLPSVDGIEATVLSVSADITEQVTRDEALRRAERMESLGDFSNGIAHDLNNVLTPILMASQMLGLSITDAAQRESVETIETAAHRAADMVRQILSYSKGIKSRRDQLELSTIFRDLRILMADAIPSRVSFSTTFRDGDVALIGDATQLLQVLVNLCINARDSIQDTGTISVSARYEESIGDEGENRRSCREAVIEVADSGHGMSPQTIGRLFEPFFTTKEEGKGTGLGLSMAAAIVRSHGGELTASSDGRTGSVFSIRIPVDDSLADPAAENLDLASESESNFGNGELVLVVDDEEEIRSAAKHVLEMHGYEVVIASGGLQAIELLQSGVATPSAIITDITMLNGSGIELESWVAKHLPETPVVLTSARRNVESLSAHVIDRISSFLEKPFNALELRTAVGTACLTGKVGKS